jgi:hypothetical protein
MWQGNKVGDVAGHAKQWERGDEAPGGRLLDAILETEPEAKRCGGCEEDELDDGDGGAVRDRHGEDRLIESIKECLTDERLRRNKQGLEKSKRASART